MKLNTLSPAEGARKDRVRVGRGIGSGLGKTAGRGGKGQKARSGNMHFEGFEGGQMPLARRVPKLKGFTNPNRVEFQVVNLERLAKTYDARSEVDPTSMVERGLVRGGAPVKVLARGEIDRALTVKAHAFSASAKEKIERAGGTAEVIV